MNLKKKKVKTIWDQTHKLSFKIRQNGSVMQLDKQNTLIKKRH
jgi:hypothetical protein